MIRCVLGNMNRVDRKRLVEYSRIIESGAHKGFMINGGGLLQLTIAVLPTLLKYPQEAIPLLVHFRKFLESGENEFEYNACFALVLILQDAPELRDQARLDLGDILYEMKSASLPSATKNYVDKLVGLLGGAPLSDCDSIFRSLVRSFHELSHPLIIVIGAGFSYEKVPLTEELNELFKVFFRNEGREELIDEQNGRQEELWDFIEKNHVEFQKAFSSWYATKIPDIQHRSLMKMMREGYVSHVISFNWDNLCERAYRDMYGSEPRKITNDGEIPDQPALWKLHGDIDNTSTKWVYPNSKGVVFDKLQESIRSQIQRSGIRHAIIIGYGEHETNVRKSLIGLLDSRGITITRVGPADLKDREMNIAATSKRFFEVLNRYHRLL